MNVAIDLLLSSELFTYYRERMVGIMMGDAQEVSQLELRLLKMLGAHWAEHEPARTVHLVPHHSELWTQASEPFPEPQEVVQAAADAGRGRGDGLRGGEFCLLARPPVARYLVTSGSPPLACSRPR